jgi:tripartite-type tricarboxylate transporter receptor subunit TctC
MNDLIAGQVQFGAVVVTGQVLQLHRSNKLHLIAVSSRTRLQAEPDVPTAVEMGYPSLIWEGFHGVFAPINTKPEILKRLTEANRAVMADKGFQKFLLDSGLEPEPDRTPEEVRSVVASEVERWTPVIKGIGLQLD